jgi:ribosomal protein L30/L7E
MVAFVWNSDHAQRGKVVARQVSEPSARQKQLLDALELDPTSKVPEAEVTAGTRKRINKVRKTYVKYGSQMLLSLKN